MRHDGETTVYQIEHQQLDGEWVGSNFDHFGATEGFAASCACYQETGILGTYDEDQGIRGIIVLARKHKGTTFRLVKRYYVQKTEVVCTYTQT